LADVLEVLRAARTFDAPTSPFVDLRTMRGAVWLEPRLQVEVTYAERRNDGRAASRALVASAREAMSRSPNGPIGLAYGPGHADNFHRSSAVHPAFYPAGY
jgi:hypothetical protein